MAVCSIGGRHHARDSSFRLATCWAATWLSLCREAGCRETGLPRVREGCEERYACSVGAVGHLCFIFNSVSKSEAELNMVFVIRCWAGGSGKMQMRVLWR